MILFTHAVVGGAVGSVIQSHPVLAFGAGFLSHFLLDAIPHWDYKLESGTSITPQNKLQGDFSINKQFLFDLIKIGTDMLSGFVITYVFIYGNILNPQDFFGGNIFWGLVGGVLPDFLQFAYYKTKKEPLTSLQKFHIWSHSSIRLHDWYILGPTIQLLIVTCVVVLAKLIH